MLQGSINLSFEELLEAGQGSGLAIFQPKAFFTVSRALQLESIYNCDYLLSQRASCKEFPKQWVFLSSVVSLETPVLLSCSTDSHWAQFKLQYKSHGIHSMMGKVHVIRGLMQVTVTPCQIRD